MENDDRTTVMQEKTGSSKDDMKKKKRKYKGRGKHGNGSNRDSKSKDECKEQKYSIYDNDLGWYAAHESLVDDVASLPTRYPLGSNVGAGDAVLNLDDNAFRVHAWPGILSLEWIPAYGKSTTQSSALNIALRNIYQEIRQKNSGAKNYESGDLGSYLILMDSIYSMIAEGKRAYGLCNYSDIYNWYIPNELLAAAGFDYQQISHDKAVFRSRLNERIIKINNFAVPNEWNIMTRHYWLNSMVFADDEDSSKAQLYVHKEMNHYTWTDYANAKLGFYNSNNKVNGIYPTIQTYFDRLDALIDNVYLFDDASLMSGDILKAYESSGLVGVSLLEENFITPIVHNKEVLQQIRNAFLLTFDTTDPQNWLEINQSLGNGGLYYQPQLLIDNTDFTDLINNWSSGQVLAVLNKIYGKQPLYLDDSYANAKGIMIATRDINLGMVIDPSISNYYALILNEVGSEIFCAGRLYVRDEATSNVSDGITRLYDPNVNGYLKNVYFRSVQCCDTNNYNWRDIDNLALMSKFSYFPRMIQILAHYNDGPGEYDYIGINQFGEMRAVAYVDKETLGNIHRVAILSLLGSKAFGSGTSSLDKK